MRLALIDVLRCPEGHGESTLVLSADAWQDGDVREGRLGCPVCRAAFPIHDGAVDFTRGAAPPPVMPLPPASPEQAMRLAAQLDLREPGGIVLLTGDYVSRAERLAGMVDVTLVALNGAAGDAATTLSVVGRLPLAPGAVRGVALDGLDRTGLTVDGILPVLRAGARLVGRFDIPLPAGITALARDDTEWVGVMDAPLPGLVRLGRGGPRGRTA